ncbi:MAG TPA: class I SAM-dependent methyltransferase [Gammaproteobacteria bacterium]|nr:class I SAM-dependent methyltransferase [Gammaproteobacteria bacterium]
MRNSVATAYLKPQREKSLRRRHPWIFSGAVERVVGDVSPGATVRVLSHSGEFLAQAAWSPASQIRLRAWTFDESAAIDAGFIGDRLEHAIDCRRELGLLDSAACRLVFSESDGLPGLIVDRYGDYLVCQFLSAGIEAWRDEVVAYLQRSLSAQGIFERSDAAVRRKEGLAASTGVLAGTPPPQPLELEIEGLIQRLDLTHGQKTGAYLDQRFNRLRVARFACGRRVLDAYSYSGAFGLHCLQAGATDATFIDSSTAALESLRCASEINGLAAPCHSIRGDVAETLRALRDAGKRFDLIVLDPPKFVHTAEQLTKGCRAYKDVNRVAFEVLSPNGVLASFSCSGHVDASLLQKVIAQAAQEAGRDARILERLEQPPDHPVALRFPESAYLNGFILRA